MNLSHNPQVTVWQFEEIEKAESGIPASAFNEVLEALVGGGQPGKKRFSRAGQCLIKQTEAEDISNWLFQDIRALKEERPSHPAAKPMPVEPRPSRPNITSGSILDKARQDAQQILEQAQAEAEQLLQKAQEEVDLFLAEASDQVAAARQEGYLEGKQAAEEEMTSLLAVVRDLVEETRDWQDALLRQSEPIIVGLIKTIAAKLFGEGIALDPQTLQQTLTRAVEKARTLGELQIYMHPADAASLDPYWREFQSTLIGSPIKILSSDSILRGGCYINGKSGSVDMRIETQLNTVLDALNMG